MPRRSWNQFRPTSLRQAYEGCIHYARDRHNLSVDRIADRMGLPSKWALYKWLESGRMPLVLLRSFEHACGCDFVTRWLAHSAHKLVVDIPTGRRSTPQDLHELQVSFNAAIGLLLRFSEGKAKAPETIGAITEVMEALAGQRANVERHAQPELDFEGDG